MTLNHDWNFRWIRYKPRFIKSFCHVSTSRWCRWSKKLSHHGRCGCNADKWHIFGTLSALFFRRTHWKYLVNLSSMQIAEAITRQPKLWKLCLKTTRQSCGFTALGIFEEINVSAKDCCTRFGFKSWVRWNRAHGEVSMSETWSNEHRLWPR